ncbi:MAG: hypothetical protein RLZZ210_1715 [Pseudomonadota bacterium]|jgi:hypothetical protein
MATAIKISDELVGLARIHASVEHRSVTKQIEYWAKLGKAVEDNPDLPIEFIKNTLLGLEQHKQGQATDYEFN